MKKYFRYCLKMKWHHYPLWRNQESISRRLNKCKHQIVFYKIYNKSRRIKSKMNDPFINDMRVLIIDII
jgi:hypothetical protein